MAVNRYTYQPEDTFIIYHQDDPGLAPIKVELPIAPPISEIQGYNLAPENQFWKVPQMPQRLVNLCKRKVADSEKRAEIYGNDIYYKNEIEWIQKEWDKIENGLWIFIKGKPFFIPGVFYFYLAYWTIDDEHPRFYKRDWKFFMFSEWTDADPMCYGFNYPKFRREGATTKVSCWRFYRAMMSRNHNAGCQSKNDTHAAIVHNEFVKKPWKKLPFFVRPIWDGDHSNTTSINFVAPVAKKDPDFDKEALDSHIDYLDAGLYAYDGTKQHSFHNDECGKILLVDVNERHQVQKPCAENGSDIIGKFRNTSTVGEMDKKGGRNFKKLCNDSHYEKRTKNNRTKSGLYNLFIPAYEGYQMGEADVRAILKQLGRDPSQAVAYPDKYGDCDIEVVTTFIKNKRQAFLDDGDIAGYIEECRQFPLSWKDCWKESSQAQNFNMLKLEKQLDFLDDEKVYRSLVVRGNFKWKDDKPDTTVFFEPSDEGKFNVSYLFDKETASNRYRMKNGIRVPGNITRFQAGGDPFKFKKTKGGKKSDGAGAVFMMQDSSIDGDGKDISTWTTNRFVCTYSHRPKDKYTYAEDMLMMCVYYGCEMYPEINVDLLWDHFETRGYFGYLTHGTDRKTNKVNKTPGRSTLAGTIEEIFREYHSYIENHCERELHRDLLLQCKMIEDDMGDYDLFTAGGYALMAAKGVKFVGGEDKVKGLEHYFDEYSFDAQGNRTLISHDEEDDSEDNDPASYFN